MCGSTGKQRRFFLATVRICFFAFFLIATAATGFAHARLARSEPKAKDILSKPPRVIELWFSEELEPGLGTIEVTDRNGTRVDRGEPSLSEDNRRLQVNLAELGAGVYTVAWKAVSRDEHTMRGSYSFTLTERNSGSGTATQTGDDNINHPSTSTLDSDANSEPYPDDAISWGQTIVRWFSYLALMTLMGSFAFRVFVLTPVFAGISDHHARFNAMVTCQRRIFRFAGVSAIALLLTSLTALWLQAMTVFNTSVIGSLSPGILLRVIRTGYGPYWVYQIISLALVAVSLWVIAARIRKVPIENPPIPWWLGFALSLLLLIGPTWTGHAMASFNEYNFSVASDWLHLVAAGIWLGGLIHLALTLPLGLKFFTGADRFACVHHAIKRFTRIALPSVVVLVLAGLYNTWIHVPRLDAFWKTPYGRILIFKLALVAIMLLLGAIHNFYFGTIVARQTKQDGADSSWDEKNSFIKRFLRSVSFEAALGVVVLLITAILVFMTPARNHPAMVQDSVGLARRN